jgi:hypothetical protein
MRQYMLPRRDVPWDYYYNHHHDYDYDYDYDYIYHLIHPHLHHLVYYVYATY